MRDSDSRVFPAWLGAEELGERECDEERGLKGSGWLDIVLFRGREEEGTNTCPHPVLETGVGLTTCMQDEREQGFKFKFKVTDHGRRVHRHHHPPSWNKVEHPPRQRRRPRMSLILILSFPHPMAIIIVVIPKPSSSRRWNR